MPRYVVLLHEDETRWADPTPELWQDAVAGHTAFARAVGESGSKVVLGEALVATHAARSVRRGRDGVPGTVTDGPHTQEAEPLGGVYVLDAPDLATVERCAGLLPSDTVEIRAVADVHVPGDDTPGGGLDS